VNAKKTYAAEHQHESAILHSKRVPDVADESEREGEIKRDGGHEAEIGDLVRRQMQLVLEQEADGDVDQSSRRAAERQQDDQDAQIEEDAQPLRRRQIRTSDGDGRDGGSRAVNRHCAQSVLCER